MFLMALVGCGNTAAGGPSGNETEGDHVLVHLVAEDLMFDNKSVSVPAGASVMLTLVNQDAVPHNFAAYRTEAAANPIFVGDLFTGPNATRVYRFEAPDDRGTYFFRCDVHPVQMRGPFEVE